MSASTVKASMSQICMLASNICQLYKSLIYIEFFWELRHH